MKRHKFTSPIGTNWDLSFWTPVNFEVEYFINEETEGVLTDTVTYFSDQHLTWLSFFLIINLVRMFAWADSRDQSLH